MSIQKDPRLQVHSVKDGNVHLEIRRLSTRVDEHDGDIERIDVRMEGAVTYKWLITIISAAAAFIITTAWKITHSAVDDAREDGQVINKRVDEVQAQVQQFRTESAEQNHRVEAKIDGVLMYLVDRKPPETVRSEVRTRSAMPVTLSPPATTPDAGRR